MDTPQKKNADAHPTKEFFVRMLVRDIELKDALLDLLDNCVDGALRQKKDELEKPKPYEGFWCDIKLKDGKIEIHDNCGGISKELATDYAFRMGRKDTERDADIATVGMYGIGMKRAFFKAGRSAHVLTQTNEDCFSVKIPENWLDIDEWHFEITDHEREVMKENGTHITIENLHDKVKEQIFSNDSTFSEDISSEISTHFAYIMERGFNFKVNGNIVKPKKISFALSEKIKPFIYEADIDDVSISMIVGFRDPMISEEDEDKEKRTKFKQEDAGWTVICNERVVLLNDKTRMTGWGDTGIPQYHSQFITISGIVEFRSKNAERLPLTTTKRGLDANSDIFLYVKHFMREGMTLFIRHTNQWKSQRDQEKKFYENAQKLSAKEAIKLIKETENEKFSQPHNRYDSKSSVNQVRYTPELPIPENSSSTRIIKFAKDIKDIRFLGDALFEDENTSPSDIGKECFERVLKEFK